MANLNQSQVDLAANNNDLGGGSMPKMNRPLSAATLEAKLDGNLLKGSYELHREGGIGSQVAKFILHGASNIKEAAVLAVEALRDASAQGIRLVCGTSAGRKASAAAGVLGWALSANSASACVISNINQLSTAEAFGNMPGSLVVNANYNDGQGTNIDYTFNAFVLGTQRDPNGNTLQTFFAVPLHGFGYQYESVKSVTDQGQALANIKMIYQSNLFNPSNPNSNAGDISIWSSSSGVTNSEIRPLAPLNSIQAGQVDFAAGVDIINVAGSAPLNISGQPTGYFAPVSFSEPLNVDSASHFSTLYSVNNLVANNGASNDQASGEMDLNSLGQIDGMVEGGTGTYTDLTRTTQNENWTSPGYNSQVAPYAGIHIVPEPTSTGIILVGTVGALSTRIRNKRSRADS